MRSALLLIFILLSELSLVSVSAKTCKDKKGKFQTKKLKSGKSMKRNCKWVKKSPKWRCNAYSGAAQHCEETCGACITASPSIATKAPVPTASPTTQIPTISTAPTAQYQWCKDTTEKFKIESIQWLKGKKKCSWVAKKTWFRCTIDEARFNCPRVCSFCSCIDNSKKFTVSSLPAKKAEKTCEWPKRGDTWWRCNHYSDVKMNCPNTCGECTGYSYPSDAPSANPTEKKFNTVNTEVKFEIEMEGLTIPEDEEELTSLKNKLATAFQSILQSGPVITKNVDFVKRERRERGIRGTQKLQEVI